MKDYSGVIHIHTRFSDGGGTPEDIIKAAHKTDVDFLIVTDHNTLKFKEEGWEGWHNKVLVLVGEEITPPRNHYLALNIDKKIEADRKTPAVYIDEVRQQGGLGFIVHPFCHRKISLPFIKDRPWTAWDAEGFSGLEIWSYMIDWIAPVNLFNLPFYYFHPQEAIAGPRKETLQVWDKMTQERQVVAVGGVDAHAKGFFPLWWLKIFPYEELFKTVRTHILVDKFEYDIEKDKNRVYGALEQGHCYVAYDFYHSSSGFEFKAEVENPQTVSSTSSIIKENGRYEDSLSFTTRDTSGPKVNHQDSIAIMGDRIKLVPELILVAKSPRKALLKLIHNGNCLVEEQTTQLRVVISQPGVYRVEAHIDNRPWVFTNPIYVVP